MVKNRTMSESDEEDLYALERQFRKQLKLVTGEEDSDNENISARLRYELRLPHYVQLFADGKAGLIKYLLIRSFDVDLRTGEIALLLLPAAACCGHLRCVRK